MPLPMVPPSRIAAGPFELTAMVEEDWHVEVTLSQDPEVLQWTHYRPNLTERDTRARLHRSSSAGPDAVTHRYRISDGTITVGVAGIFADPGTVPEIYYALIPDGRGRGAATHATRALAEWLLQHGSETVTLVIFAGNVASEAVARRSGFSPAWVATTDHRGVLTETSVWHRSA